LYRLNEFLVGLLDVGVLADGFPKVSSIDIDIIDTRVSFFSAISRTPAATKYEVEVGEVSSKFSRFAAGRSGARFDPPRAGMGMTVGDAHCNWKRRAMGLIVVLIVV